MVPQKWGTPPPPPDSERGVRAVGVELLEAGASYTTGGSRSRQNSAPGEFEMETYVSMPFDPAVPRLEIFLSE